MESDREYHEKFDEEMHEIIRRTYEMEYRLGHILYEHREKVHREKSKYD